MKNATVNAMKSPAFTSQFGKKFFFKEGKEIIQKVGFDEQGEPVYMETEEDKNGQVINHLRGQIIDAKFYCNRPKA